LAPVIPTVGITTDDRCQGVHDVVASLDHPAAARAAWWGRHDLCRAVRLPGPQLHESGTPAVAQL